MNLPEIIPIKTWYQCWVPGTQGQPKVFGFYVVDGWIMTSGDPALKGKQLGKIGPWLKEHRAIITKIADIKF